MTLRIKSIVWRVMLSAVSLGYITVGKASSSTLDIFDAAIFSHGKQFISSSLAPMIYLEFHKSAEGQWFNIRSYQKGHNSFNKKLGEIEVSYAPLNNVIWIKMPQWSPLSQDEQHNAKLKQEALETSIGICRSKHCKNHFSCKTFFSLSLHNIEIELAKAIGFNFINTEGALNLLVLPFKSLELDKFPGYDLHWPRDMGVNEGKQHPYYGTIDKIIEEDLDSFQDTRTPFVWCDLGCGTGLFPLRLLEKSDYITVIANDYNASNLQVLRTFIKQAEEKAFKKDILKNLSILQGDLRSLKKNSDFIPLLEKGIHRFSLMNVLHYLSPFQNLLTLAFVSDALPLKGRVYIIHDTDKVYIHEMEEVTACLKMCVDRDITEGCLKRIPFFGSYIQQFRISKIRNFLKGKGFEFPGYINRDVLDVKDYEGFNFSPPLMMEMADAVGLKIVQKGESMSMLDKARGMMTYPDAKEGEGVKAWYVFEKNSPTITSGGTPFTDNPKFKALAERALRSDQQRKGFNKRVSIDLTAVYPFINIREN